MSKVSAGLVGVALGLALGLSVQALAAPLSGGPSGARSLVLITRQPEVRILDLPPGGLLATYSALSNYPFPAVQAITGGTGIYRGVRGQVNLVARGGDLIQTMQMEP